MKFLFVSLLLIVIFNLQISCQVVLNRRNFERVNFSNSEDSSERKYYETIAFVINDYVKKFHKHEKLRIIITMYKTPYEVILDNELKTLINQLQSEDKKLDYGLFVRLPDSCLSMSRMFNLIDLGFDSKDSMLSCLKKRYITTTKWFPQEECYPSQETIDNFINMNLPDNQNRFLKKMMRKYNIKNANCIKKSSFKSDQ